MPRLKVLDHHVYYETGGQGPPVVLLHHATATLQNWQKQIPLLHELGYTTLAYDRHGFGRSDPLPAWTLDYHEEGVNELIALLDALGWDQVALVGHSDGATISLMTAARHPDRVGAIVAEAPHMWIRGLDVASGFDTFRKTVDASPRFHRAMQRVHGPQAQQVLRRWYERWLDPAFRDWDVSADLPRVQCPVLVLHGEHDIFFPYSHSQAIAAQLPSAVVELIPDAGHVPHRENRPLFERYLRQFLLQHWPPPPI